MWMCLNIEWKKVFKSRWASYIPFPCIFIQSCIKIQYNISTSSHDEVTSEFAKLQKLKGYLSSSEKDFLAILKIMSISAMENGLGKRASTCSTEPSIPGSCQRSILLLWGSFPWKRTTSSLWNFNEFLHFHNLILFCNHITAVLIKIFN